MICAKCGIKLGDVEEDSCRLFNLPGACARHKEQILREHEKGYSMWPADWAGHSLLLDSGQWEWKDPLHPIVTPFTIREGDKGGEI